MGTSAAPRIDERLCALIAAAPADASAADVTRRVGQVAWELGRPRPSYQQVRLVLKESRYDAQQLRHRDVLFYVWIGARPAWDLEKFWYGERLPDRVGARNEPRRAG